MPTRSRKIGIFNWLLIDSVKQVHHLYQKAACLVYAAINLCFLAACAGVLAYAVHDRNNNPTYSQTSRQFKDYDRPMMVFLWGGSVSTLSVNSVKFTSSGRLNATTFACDDVGDKSRHLGKSVDLVANPLVTDYWSDMNDGKATVFGAIMTAIVMTSPPDKVYAWATNATSFEDCNNLWKPLGRAYSPVYPVEANATVLWGSLYKIKLTEKWGFSDAMGKRRRTPNYEISTYSVNFNVNSEFRRHIVSTFQQFYFIVQFKMDQDVTVYQEVDPANWLTILSRWGGMLDYVALAFCLLFAASEWGIRKPVWANDEAGFGEPGETKDEGTQATAQGCGLTHMSGCCPTFELLYLPLTSQQLLVKQEHLRVNTEINRLDQCFKDVSIANAELKGLIEEMAQVEERLSRRIVEEISKRQSEIHT